LAADAFFTGQDSELPINRLGELRPNKALADLIRALFCGRFGDFRVFRFRGGFSKDGSALSHGDNLIG